MRYDASTLTFILTITLIELVQNLSNSTLIAMTERTVLVTGATGLLGREVSASFGLRGWNVKGTGYSRADGISTLKVDLGNESEVASLLDETKFEHPLFC